MNDRMDEIRSTRAPTLREDQIGILRRYGQERKTEIGDVLFRAGDTKNDFIVILEGEVEVVDDFAGDARTIGVFLAGRFLGELNMLTGQAVYERPDEAPVHEAWVSAFVAALRQGDPGVYVNFLGDEGEGRIREAYPGSTWERLAAIKSRYDPTNLFRLNQNIRPTAQD